MSESTLTPSATVDVAAINLNHQKCRSHAAKAVVRGIICGLQLIEAKRNVPHGHFGKIWEETDFSERTGQNYMTVAKGVKNERLGKSATVADLLRLPEPELLQVIEGAVAGDSMRQLMVDFGIARPRPEEIRTQNLTGSGSGSNNGSEAGAEAQTAPAATAPMPRRQKQQAIQMLFPIFQKMASVRAVGQDKFRAYLLRMDLRADADELKHRKNLGLLDLESELKAQLEEVQQAITKVRKRNQVVVDAEGSH